MHMSSQIPLKIPDFIVFLLYKSSLKAGNQGLLADRWGLAFETTTSMRANAAAWSPNAC